MPLDLPDPMSRSTTVKNGPAACTVVDDVVDGACCRSISVDDIGQPRPFRLSDCVSIASDDGIMPGEGMMACVAAARDEWAAAAIALAISSLYFFVCVVFIARTTCIYF